MRSKEYASQASSLEQGDLQEMYQDEGQGGSMSEILQWASILLLFVLLNAIRKILREVCLHLAEQEEKKAKEEGK
ncbi:MAG: hypothetical protein WC822_02395 [Candidatus Paceibacterota bacterium]|jgi:hypothetical protein